MFTVEHFIWLAIAAAVVTFMLILNKKKGLSLEQNLNIMVVVLFLSETVKTFNYMIPSEEFGGMYLSVEALPFHLCSMQIFFILYLRFICKSETVKKNLMGFMFPTMLLGGILAMLIPTNGVAFNTTLAYQYFGYHMFITYFALYMVIFGQVEITKKTIMNNFVYLLCLVVAAIWINSILQYGGANFMFIERPPMAGLPYLNLDRGWPVYFARLIGLGVVLALAVQLPFVKRVSK